MTSPEDTGREPALGLRGCRIGVVAVSDPSLGGTFQYTMSTIDALRRIRGVELTLFTSSDNHHYDSLGLQIARLPGGWRTFWQFLGNRIGGRHGGRAFNGEDALIAPIYTTRLLAAAQPFVFTLHDLQERYFPENFSFAQRVWRNLSNRALTRAAAAIICESNNVRADIERFFSVPHAKISVIPAPPVSTLAQVRVTEEMRNRVKVSLALPEQFVFYPAQFFPHKNHIRLVEAFARTLESFPNCQLVLTGQKRYEYKRVFSRLEQLRILGKVRHLGYIDSDSLAAVYTLATCVIVPTLFESISIPIYEAFTLGVPVCASNVVALPEQVGDAGLLFDPLCVADIAEKLQQLLGSPVLREQLVARGKARISRLSSTEYARQLELVLAEVVMRSKRCQS